MGAAPAPAASLTVGSGGSEGSGGRETCGNKGVSGSHGCQGIKAGGGNATEDSCGFNGPQGACV